MRIRVRVDGGALDATLDDTAAARDLAALLPLELALEDYATTEKIADLPRRLSTAGAPAGTAAAAGDICYYAPWGNLALFYRNGSHAKGLVKLGRLDTQSSRDILRLRGSLHATIEVVET